jgi:hypothetical protein
MVFGSFKNPLWVDTTTGNMIFYIELSISGQREINDHWLKLMAWSESWNHWSSSGLRPTVMNSPAIA